MFQHNRYIKDNNFDVTPKLIKKVTTFKVSS